MSRTLSKALKQVRDILQKEAHKHCVAVNISFTSQGYEIDYRLRTPSGLQRDGYSMRNLKGDWIK